MAEGTVPGHRRELQRCSCEQSTTTLRRERALREGTGGMLAGPLLTGIRPFPSGWWRTGPVSAVRGTAGGRNGGCNPSCLAKRVGRELSRKEKGRRLMLIRRSRILLPLLSVCRSDHNFLDILGRSSAGLSVEPSRIC